MATRPDFKRINLDDPEQMAKMLRSGAIWKLPQFWQQGLSALEKGLVPLSECKDVPPQIVEALK